MNVKKAKPGNSKFTEFPTLTNAPEKVDPLAMWQMIQGINERLKKLELIVVPVKKKIKIDPITIDNAAEKIHSSGVSPELKGALLKKVSE